MPGLVPRLSGCAKKSRHARESKWNRTFRRLGRACPGHPRRAVARNFRSWRLPHGVDARDEPGHDARGPDSPAALCGEKHVMPGLVPRLSGCAKKSRHARESKWNRTFRRLGRACPGHPRRAVARNFRSWRVPHGVDARDEPGHDARGPDSPAALCGEKVARSAG
jgi:hypothetical protein